MFKRKTVDMKDLGKALKEIRILTPEQRDHVMGYFEKNKYTGLDEFKLKNIIHEMHVQSEGKLSRFAASQVERTLSDLALPDKDVQEEKPKRNP